MAQNQTKKKTKASQKLFLQAFEESAIRGSRSPFNISAACKAAGIGRRTFYNWLDGDEAFKVAFEEMNESRLDSIESALYNQGVLHKDTAALIFLAKTQLKNRGYIEGQRVAVQDKNPILLSVIDDLLNNKVDVGTAALKLTKAGIPLPESIKIMLSKQSVEENEPDLPCPSSEELDRRMDEALNTIEIQREQFLPQRQAEVQELKENMKKVDSFGPETS